MNKQEAIEKIKNIDTLNINDKIAGQSVDMVIKNQVLALIEQINEPKKPVVPKFVAEWIKSQKKSFLDVSAIDMYDNLTLDNNGGHYHVVWLWVINHHYDFIKAWHDGYTVEQEKLYMVEVLDSTLFKITSDNHVRYKLIGENAIPSESKIGNYTFEVNLTEKEIKEADERLWEFAKPAF